MAADPARTPLVDDASTAAPARRALVGAGLAALAVFGLSSSLRVPVVGPPSELRTGEHNRFENGHPADDDKVVPADELVLTALTNTDAVCMDGSVPMYYYAPATSNPSTWLVELNEGAFCYDAETCARRAAEGASEHMYVGSSEFPAHFIREGSILYESAEELADEPLDLRGAHRVLLAYCTSDLHLGQRAAPTADGVGPMMGAAVVDALLDELRDVRGLAGAETFVLIGSSAGAAAASVALPHVAERVKAAAPDATVVGLFDSGGFFAESGENLARKASALMDLSGARVPAACAEAHAGAEWKCLIFTHLYDAGVFDGIPFIITQFQRDQFQIKQLLSNTPDVLAREGLADVRAEGVGDPRPSYAKFLDGEHAFLARVAADTRAGATEAAVFAPKSVGHIIVNLPYVYARTDDLCTVDGVTARVFVSRALAKFSNPRKGADKPNGAMFLIDDMPAPTGDNDAAIAADIAGDKCGGYIDWQLGR